MGGEAEGMMEKEHHKMKDAMHNEEKIGQEGKEAKHMMKEEKGQMGKEEGKMGQEHGMEKGNKGQEHGME